MAQGCLKCLKLTMCGTNFLCFICGVAVLGLGIYLLVGFKMEALTPNLASGNILIISGIIITCVSFLGFLGALKENRCLLLMFFLLLFCLMLLELTAACLLLVYEGTVGSIGDMLKEELNRGLKKALNSTEGMSDWKLIQEQLHCCGVTNATDWGEKVPTSCKAEHRSKGCFDELKNLFERHFLTTGVSVIVLCIVEVLGMCFAMTLYCHISRSGLGYKL